MRQAVRVEFPKPQQHRMRRELSRAGPREIGGILMAEQLEPGSFRIVDFSIDSATGSAAHFVRSVNHHREALAQFFERTGSDFMRFNYLGEWHSHPNHLPIPSQADASSMRALIHGERDIPFAMLLIVKRKWWRGLTCSATLYQQHHPPELIELTSTPT